MVDQIQAGAVSNVEFKLLSVAALLNKINNNTSIEELHRDAARKFDTLVDLLSGRYTDNNIISKFGYSLNDLRRISILVFDKLISENNDNPYISLCASESCSLEEIKRRRNMLLHIFHPDRNSEKLDNGTKTRIINQAYKLLAGSHIKDAISDYRDIPPSYPYNYQSRSRKRLTILLAILCFLLVFFIFLNRSYFFQKIYNIVLYTG